MTTLKKFVSAVSATLSTTGRVVAATETTLSVATRTGVVLVPKNRNDLYSVGDEVKVSNGAIAGKIKDTSSLPIYHV